MGKNPTEDELLALVKKQNNKNCILIILFCLFQVMEVDINGDGNY